MAGPLYLVPVSFRDAAAFTAMWHRHHEPPQGMKYAVGVANEGGGLVAVAIAGRPVARNFDNGLTVEITRVTSSGARNACSMLYAACWRGAKALGYCRAVSYTLGDEDGASLKAAGFVKVAVRPPHKGWGRDGRHRDLRGDEHLARALWVAERPAHQGWNHMVQPEDWQDDNVPPTLWDPYILLPNTEGAGAA